LDDRLASIAARRGKNNVNNESTLRMKRKEMNLSIEDMAHLLGCSPGHVSRLERRKAGAQSPENIMRLSKRYGLSIEQVVRSLS